MRLRGKLCSKSRLIKKKNADFHLYDVSCSTFLFFFFAFLLLFFPFFFPQFRLKLKNPTSVSNEISTKRVLLPVSNFSDEPRNKILSLPPFLFYLFFSLSPFFYSHSGLPPFGYRPSSLSSRTKKFPPSSNGINIHASAIISLAGDFSSIYSDARFKIWLNRRGTIRSDKAL